MKNTPVSDFFRKLDIKTYLLGAFILSSVIPIITLGAIEYKFIAEQTIDSVKKENSILIDNINGKIIDYIQKESEILKIAYENVSNEKDNEKIDQILSNILKVSEDIYFVEYYRGDYSVFKSQFDIDDSRKFLEKDNLIEELEKKQGFLINPMIESQLLEIVEPLISNNKVTGYLLISFDLKKIFSYLNKIIKNKEEIYIYDYNDDKIVFSSKNKKFIDKRVFKYLINENITNPNFVTSKIEILGWAILLEHSISMSDEGKLKKNVFSSFIAAITSLFLATGLGLWISYSQYRFVRMFIKSIKEVEKGNYKSQLALKLILIPKEFTMVMEQFNSMVRRIALLDSFKSNLIDTVSHEFRTPLTSIKGFSSTLLRADTNFDKETTRRFLKNISVQSDRLSRMIDDLLVVPRLEGNFIKLDLIEIDLEEHILQVAEFFQNVNFEFELEEGIYVFADSDRLQQILTNLFGNAKKYSDPQNSPIHVKTFKEANFAKITVSNSAPNISKETLNTLFDKFVRLDNELTRTTGGTGLGLFITKGLIKLMNGKIWLESTDEVFSVCFTLPLVEDF